MKKLVLTVSALLLSATLVACGNTTPDPVASTTPVVSGNEEAGTPDVSDSNTSVAAEPDASVIPEETAVDPMAFETTVPFVTGMEDIDTIIQTAYNYVKSEDFNGLTVYDSDATVSAAAASLISEHSDSDRYITYLEAEKTYGMLYYNQEGGYWWYFGDIVNGAREGHGKLFIAYEENCYTFFEGEYKNDEANGQGTYTKNYSGFQSFKGNFTGMVLNGSFECYAFARDTDGNPMCEITQTLGFTDGKPDAILNAEVDEMLYEGIQLTDEDYVYMWQENGEALAYWHVNATSFDELAGNPAYAQ